MKIELGEDRLKELFNQNKWFSADGRVYFVDDMGVSHMLNTIDLIKRNLRDGSYRNTSFITKLAEAYICKFYCEIVRRGFKNTEI